MTKTSAAALQLQRVSARDAAGKTGKLKPAIGLRLGYAFPGFWLTK